MRSVTVFPLITTVALGAVAAGPATAAAQDGPVEVWVSQREHLDYGDNVRVYVRTTEDGHVVVLHADPEGRVRVLYPIDPFSDDFIRGGREYEVRDRRDRPAVRVTEESGFGTVYVAYSRDPFRYGAFAREDHWDFRAFTELAIQEDPERELTEIAQQMAVGANFTYDLETYYVNPPVTRTLHSYGGYYDDYRYGYNSRFYVGVVPRYYYLNRSRFYYPRHRYRSGLFIGIGVGLGHYGGPYYYDPFFYDPFFHDPFWYSSHYYGQRYYGNSYYYFYGPSYAGPSSPRRVTSFAFATRNRANPVIANYRDRRLTPTGTLAAGPRRRTPTATTVGQAQPRRAGAEVTRRTPVRAPSELGRRTTAGRETAAGRRTAIGPASTTPERRSPTRVTEGNTRRTVTGTPSRPSSPVRSAPVRRRPSGADAPESPRRFTNGTAPERRATPERARVEPNRSGDESRRAVTTAPERRSVTPAQTPNRRPTPIRSGGDRTATRSQPARTTRSSGPAVRQTTPTRQARPQRTTPVRRAPPRQTRPQRATPTRDRPTLQRRSPSSRPSASRPSSSRSRPAVRRPTTSSRPAVRRPTSSSRPAVRQPTATSRPAVRRPTTRSRPTVRRPTTTTRRRPNNS